MADDSQAYQTGKVAYRTGSAAYGPSRKFPMGDRSMEIKPDVSPSYDPMKSYGFDFPEIYDPRVTRDL